MCIKTFLFGNTFITYELHSFHMYIVRVAKAAIIFFPLSFFFLKCYSEDTGVSESDKGIYIKKNKK